jgi:hypothetical protein
MSEILETSWIFGDSPAINPENDFENEFQFQLQGYASIAGAVNSRASA